MEVVEETGLKTELENIERYFNGKELIDTENTELCMFAPKDQWTEFLNSYLENNQQEMARYVGIIESMEWKEEEKLWWSILFAEKCDGSDAYMEMLMDRLHHFRSEDYAVSELLERVGSLLLKREKRSRDESYQKRMDVLQNAAAAKEEKLNTARGALQAHEQTGNQ